MKSQHGGTALRQTGRGGDGETGRNENWRRFNFFPISPSPLLPVLFCLVSLYLCVKSARGGDEFTAIEAKIVSFKLDNGLTIILYPRGDAPVISCVTCVKTGSVDEQVGITGIAHQLEHLAFKGTLNVGAHDYPAEQKAMAEIDAVYKEVQALEQKLPAEMRDALLTLLAQATNSGFMNCAQETARLCESWQNAGITLPDTDKARLGELVAAYAEKVKAADRFVEPNEFAGIIDRNGGQGLNAYTTTDRTVYHMSLPANKLELWASLESDRFMNTVPRQLEKEKQVVLEERRMRTESDASGKLYEEFIGVAFKSHPYGVPVIGSRSDILGYTREKIMNFYRAHYVPSLTYVAVVGDIDVEAARKLLSDYFGRIPPAPEPEPLVTVEPPQEGERRVEVEFPAQPLLLLGYHVPERNHPDTPALKVLDAIATSGRASRLYTRLVKSAKASSVGSWIGPGERYPRLLCFSAEPTAGGLTSELEPALLMEIEKLKTEAPTAEELARVVTAYRANVLRALKANLGLAQQLADFQALSGDWRNLFRDIEQIGAVKPEQVTAVAAKYLTRQNRTVGRILSTSQPSTAPATVLGVTIKQ